MRIEEEYKKTGYFWLPGEEARKIPGVLSINEGGKIELEIIGHFNESIENLREDNNIIRIIGHVEKDGLVTLDHCFYINKNIAFGGISKSKILVQRVLSGAAWDKDEPLTFNTFYFSVDCLDEWVGISGINVDRDQENKTTKITYTPPEKISFPLDNGMELEINFAYSLPSFPLIKEAKITQSAYFTLKSKELCELKEFTIIAFQIVNLMCFAMDDIVSIKKVSATSPEIIREAYDDINYPAPIKIYYQSLPYSEKTPKRNWHDMLFHYRIIKDNAQQVFNNWLNAYEYLQPAFSLYFSAKTGAQRFLEGKFLALAQGLETYHRRTSDEKLMEAEEFDLLVNKILQTCPNENIEWLRGRLTHGNEISLSKRLKRIIEPFKEYLGTSKDRGKLLIKIVDTRNYLTHYSENLESKTAKGRDLFILCMKMEAIFILHFLNVVGFSTSEVKNAVENCYSLKQKLREL